MLKVFGKKKEYTIKDAINNAYRNVNEINQEKRSVQSYIKRQLTLVDQYNKSGKRELAEKFAGQAARGYKRLEQLMAEEATNEEFAGEFSTKVRTRTYAPMLGVVEKEKQHLASQSSDLYDELTKKLAEYQGHAETNEFANNRSTGESYTPNEEIQSKIEEILSASDARVINHKGATQNLQNGISTALSQTNP